MKDMIKIKECLKHLAIWAMFLLVGGSVYAQTEPTDDEVFDLVAYEDNTGIKFKNGNDSVGYLRVSGKQDPSYYIFTNKKYIRVSVEGDIEVKTSVRFDFVVKDGRYQEGTSNSIKLNSKRTRGYYVLDNELVDFELAEGNKFIIASKEETYYDNPLLTIRTMSGEDKISKLNGDTLSFNAGDTIKFIKVKRERRGFIDGIIFNGVKLYGTYKLNDNPVEYEVDDIVNTISSLSVLKENILPNEAVCFPLEVHLRYIKDGNLVPFVKTVTIKVEKQEELAEGISFWMYIALFVIGVILFVVITLILIKRKKNSNDKDKVEKESVDSNDNNAKVNTIRSAQDGISRKEEQVFENISNKEAALCLLRLLGKKDEKIDIEILNKKLSKLWVKEFCKEWNNQYRETDYCIEEGKFDKEFIFKNINNWIRNAQNAAHKDGYNEAQQELGKNVQVYDQDKQNLLQQIDGFRIKIESILQIMKENHYEVNSPIASSVKDGLKTIEKAITEGVQQDKLQKRIKELKGELKTQKENTKQQLSDLEGIHQQALKAKDEECKIAMDAQKNKYEGKLTQKDTEHQQKLAEKDKTHQEQMDAKETAHLQELDRLNQEHAGTVANLNGMIQTKNAEIKQLKVEGRKDCASFVNMVVKRMNGVGVLLNELHDDVCLTSGDNETQYTNILRKAKEDYELFANQVAEAKDGDKWSQASIIEVCQELQSYASSGLRNSGWVNIVHYLNLYAGTTEKLNDSFNENGLSTIKLVKLVADIQRLLGMFGVKVVVPHLLMDKFDDKAFDFENADRWIQAFASDLKPNDYESRVFDMSVVGYQMEDGRYNKPRVFYS